MHFFDKNSNKEEIEEDEKRREVTRNKWLYILYNRLLTKFLLLLNFRIFFGLHYQRKKLSQLSLLLN